MKILAIDTSCDDTSIAISNDKKIIANVSWSKAKLHNEMGGVVPSEAKRQHKEFLDPAIEKALHEANLKIENIDTIAVTYGPGLAIALETGILKAKELSIEYNKPLIAVNHMIGHIYSNLAENENGKSYSGINNFEFPLLALTISGGHTDLYLMKSHLEFEHIGRTLDDAIGEAFDKVGRMLGMGFPAGAKVEDAATVGNPNAFEFPRPMSNSGDLNWSFSGLKTAVLYQIKKIQNEYEIKPNKKEHKMIDESNSLSKKLINDVAASFQEAATESLLIKLKKALQQYNPKMLIVGGGVVANSALRAKLNSLSSQSNIPLYYPKPMWLCTDNASMIAVAGYYYAKAGFFVQNISALDRVPSLEINP